MSDLVGKGVFELWRDSEFFEEFNATQEWLAGSWVFHLEDPIENSWWWDEMAIWHNNAGTLSFADGHAEMVKWVDSRTVERSKQYPKIGEKEASHNPLNKDVMFLARAYGGYGDRN